MVFEFVIAAVLLFGIIIYSISLMNTNVSQFRDDYHHNDLEMRATQISEMLVHNKGDYSDPVVLGLSSGWSKLSLTQVNNLDVLCSNPPGYADLLESLNLLEAPYLSGKSNLDFNITVQNRTDLLVSCGDPSTDRIPSNRYVGHSKRFIHSEDGSVVSIDVWVW